MFVFVYQDNSIAYIGDDIEVIVDAEKIKVDDDLKPFDYSKYKFINGEFVKIDYSRLGEVLSEISEIDFKSIRPLRAIAAGTATEYDYIRLSELEAQRKELTAEKTQLEAELESLNNV